MGFSTPIVHDGDTWTESTLTDAETGVHTATVLLHQGVFKASYADCPTT